MIYYGCQEGKRNKMANNKNLNEDNSWIPDEEQIYSDFMRKMDIERTRRAWERGERAPGTVDLNPVEPKEIDITKKDEPAKPAGVFSNIDAFVKQGMPKSAPAKKASRNDNVVRSGSGEEVSTGSGGKLRTRSADEFSNNPQDYYRRMMRPGQNEDTDMSELIRLSGLLNEKAVSKQQQKFMGMVHAMQKGEKIKGASTELKKVAKTMSKKDAKDFASTKHKDLPKRVTEDIMLDEGGQALKHITNRFKYEVKNFMNSGLMDDDLYEALYDYYADAGEMPYGVAKARTGDPHQWVEERFYQDMGSGMSEAAAPAQHDTLSELARLAGLNEDRVDECGDMGTDQQSSMNVSTNMSSDGNKNVTISASGDQAEALIDMLRLAGMGNDHVEQHEEPEVVMVSGDEMMDEDSDDGVNNPVANAIVRRITNQRMDLLKKYGPAAVTAAVDEVADFVGDVEEIGSSDVSGWVRHVEQLLGNMGEGGLEEEYANEPEEEYQTIASITRQGNDLNREKKQYAGKPRLGDNPMAEEMLDEELSNLLDSILIKRDMDEGVLDTVGSAISKGATAVSNFAGDVLGTEASALRNSPQLQQLDVGRKQFQGTPQGADFEKRYQQQLTRVQTGSGEVMDYDPKTGKSFPKAVNIPPVKAPAAPAAPATPNVTPKPRWAGSPTDVTQLEKGGIKGATMAPPDSKYPPGDKRNLTPTK
jgi:hypothetical protein